MTGQPIHVVWHCAAMGHWQTVAAEQLQLLAGSGLHEVDCSFVGFGADWLTAEAQKHGITLRIVRQDVNVLHYETFAMLHIEQLARQTERPILYFHTKGVSYAPDNRHKRLWRKLMEEHVVRQWARNLDYLQDHDAVGVNWFDRGEQHFSGTFWIARPDWIRRLPEFATYHAAKNRVRFSCEMWIGAAQWCRAKSLVCRNEPWWCDEYRFERWFTDLKPVRLNLGSNQFYAEGWVNVDLDKTHRADLYEDVETLPSIGAGTVDEIYAGHVAEHVNDVEATFKRWHDVMRPGGVLTVVVPDGPGSVRHWVSGRHWPGIEHPSDAGIVAVATGYHSREHAGRDPELLQMHRRVWDASTLTVCLKYAGFRDVQPTDDHPLMVRTCRDLSWQLALRAAKA